MIRKLTTLSSDSKQVIDIITKKQKQKNGSVTSRKGVGQPSVKMCDEGARGSNMKKVTYFIDGPL